MNNLSNNAKFSSDFLGLTELFADWTVQAKTNGLLKLFHDAGWDDWTTLLAARSTDRAAVKVGMYNCI